MSVPAAQQRHQLLPPRKSRESLVVLTVLTFLFLICSCNTDDITENTQHSECLYTHYGTAYDGTVSTTRTGKTCQSWNSQSPHSHPYTNHDHFPDASLTDAYNYCRNPTGVRPRGVWCYTMDPNTEWEYCDVDYCECKIHRSGHGYLGTHAATYTGIPCQRWDSQSPHTHSYTSENFEDFTLSDASNYCRNPNPNWHWGTYCLTTSPTIKWQHCSIPFCECKTTPGGHLYEGYLTTTVSGKSCQAWSSQTPHQHSYDHISMFPDTRMEAAGSHCRNPDDNHQDGPWCFTTDPHVRWEQCNIKMCEYLVPLAQLTTTTTEQPSTTPYTGPTVSRRSVEENITQPIQECKFSRTGSSYRGSKSVTVSGKTCQAWNAQTPHDHLELKPESIPDKSVEDASNKCRNPSMSTRGPWCFTADPNTRYEYCDVPLCNCKTSRSGSEYSGYKRKTRSGIECQSWNTQTPHRHDYTDASFPIDGGRAAAENYCRNPDNDDPNGPWCLTTDSEIRWEYCGVPFCECKQDMEGHQYQGRISVTVSGLRCQRWDSQSPHSHNRNDPSGFPGGNVETASNFCRNPDQEPQGPWCYTTAPEKRWEYCDIPLCELDKEDRMDIQGTSGMSVEHIKLLNCKLSKTGETFQGSVSHTVSYRACQRWDAQKPHPHPYSDVTAFPDADLKDAGDTCRNPRKSQPEGPWCYTLDPDVEWEYCPVPECGCKSNKGGWTYNGTKAVTRNGYTCQRWDTQTPQPHTYATMAKYFPDAKLEDAANYCRNPQVWEPDGPWCFTTDPHVRYDYCDIPYCECKTMKAGHEYGGRIFKTKSGRTCQRWDAQTPHAHPYYDKCLFVDETLEDARNYCRNPDANELEGPFCYTTDPNVRWEYCDIPMCDNAGQHPLITEHGEAQIEAHAEKLLSSRPSQSDQTPTVIVLSIFLVLLILILLAIAAYHRRQVTALYARAKESLVNKSFDNPLYGQTPASSATFGGGTSVKLEVPEQQSQPTTPPSVTKTS